MTMITGKKRKVEVTIGKDLEELTLPFKKRKIDSLRKGYVRDLLVGVTGWSKCSDLTFSDFTSFYPAYSHKILKNGLCVSILSQIMTMGDNDDNKVTFCLEFGRGGGSRAIVPFFTCRMGYFEFGKTKTYLIMTCFCNGRSSRMEIKFNNSHFNTCIDPLWECKLDLIPERKFMVHMLHTLDDKLVFQLACRQGYLLGSLDPWEKIFEADFYRNNLNIDLAYKEELKHLLC